MTIEDILGGENKSIEYKGMRPAKSKNYMKTVIAFCNGTGGKLVFGIEDNTHAVIGVPEDILFAEIDAIANAISDQCEPMIVPDIYMQTIDDKTVIVVDIDEGVQKPYYIKSEGIDNGTYIRVAGTSRPADEYMIQELRLEGSRRSFDEMPCIGLEITSEDISDLCKRMKEEALSNTLNEEDKKEIKDLTVEQLISWRVIREKNGKYYPNNAYAILKGDYRVPNMIQCGVFKGSTKAVFVDRREYTGSAWELVEAAYQYVLRNIRMRATFKGVHRLDVYEIPPFAIRELIVNAVVHRSYVDRGNIQIALYDNRLEIFSPGKLPKTQTFESMEKGRSKIRNEALAKAFFYMRLMEKWGSGIPRVVQEVCDEGLATPVFEGGEVDVVVSIYRKGMETHTDIFITDATDSETKDGGKANNITATIKDEAGGNGGNGGKVGGKAGGNGGKVGGNGGKVGGNGGKVGGDGSKVGGNGGINTDESVGYEADIIRYVRLHPNATQRSINTAIGVPLRTIQRIMSQLQNKGILIREGSRRFGQWKVID